MSGEWWRTAVMYQVYIRSFADGNGDGVGDLPGLLQRLPYLRDLGVDGLWITPWFTSPMKDGGYDVADYTDIDPLFGTLDDARAVIERSHRLGLKIIVDWVPNHTSDQHPWFRAALAAAPGSPERARYHFRDGRGEHGELPPNDWISAFGGPAWTRVPDGAWYLHLFAPAQPDLNWDDLDVRADFERFMRFWFDLGLDGLRIDVASGIAKHPDLPDFGEAQGGMFAPVRWVDAPHWDHDGVHEILRSWRKIADSFDRELMYVGEVTVNGMERLARYMRPDELHTTFNLDVLKAPLDASVLRATISASLSAFAEVGAPATWTLSNHDETRFVTRYGRAYTGVPLPEPYPFPTSDRALGTRRAKAMVLTELGLPGSVYLYQGEELGLAQVEDLADDVLQDPIWESSGHTVRGRDGCRVPLPWSGSTPPFGFSPDGVQPWLPQPVQWATMTAEAENADAGSVLAFYRNALRRRREVMSGDGFAWADLGPDVLAFDRDGVRVVFNLSQTPVYVTGQVLLTSDALTLTDGLLPPDTAAWTRLL